MLTCHYFGVARSGESPERSEIQLDEGYHNEHPKAPLIPDLTRPVPDDPAVGRVGQCFVGLVSFSPL